MIIPRVNILGVGVSAVNMEDVLTTMDQWITKGNREYVCVACINTIMSCQDNPLFTDVVNGAGMVVPDGIPLVWLAWLHGEWHTRQVCGEQLVLKSCEFSLERGYRHYFYGGAPGVAQQLANTLEKRYPGLQVAGFFSPPFRPVGAIETSEIIRQINATEPDIIWVGMSTPKQDVWMAQHRPLLSAPVLVGVGAAFDFHTGHVKAPPKLMRLIGLSWLFRLVQEPSRLWRRYFPNNLLFALKISKQIVDLGFFRKDEQ